MLKRVKMSTEALGFNSPSVIGQLDDALADWLSACCRKLTALKSARAHADVH